MTHHANSHLAAPECSADRDSFTSWRMIAIARDWRQVWLGWHAPTLTQRVGTWPVWSQHPLRLPLVKRWNRQDVG